MKEPTFDDPLTACPLCSSDQIHQDDHDYLGCKIFRCSNCRLLFMNPQYTDEHLAEFYAGYMYKDTSHIGDAEMACRTESKTDDLRLIERHISPGRFLSIGCGDGLELKLARQRGWEVEGYDVDPQITGRVAETLNATVHTGDFFQLNLPSNHYDCVFMDQVLEHPKNPQAYLEEIHRILADGGILFIGCPNITSLSNQLKTVLGKLGLKKNRGKHYCTFHHLFFYSPHTLKKIIERHYGYKAVAVEGDSLSGWKSRVPGTRWYDKPLNYLRRKFPVMESNFRLLVRKCAQSNSQASVQRRAA